MKNATIRQFEKAKKLHDEIVVIDKEIMDIEKLANEAANDNCTLKFGVKVENYTKTSEKKKDIFDEDNSLQSIYSRFLSSSMFTIGSSDEKKIHTDEYRFKFTDTDCLQVLAVLLKIKYAQRNILIRQINRLGVEV